jgi:hypothetical protein
MVDCNGYTFAVLAGMPADQTYNESAYAAFKELKAAGEGEIFKAKEHIHQRGQFPFLPFGISYGNGHQVPARLGTKGHDMLIKMMQENKNIKRIANYADGEFGTRAISYFLTD